MDLYTSFFVWLFIADIFVFSVSRGKGTNYVRTDDIILPTYKKYYYFIVFDENNIAVAVFYEGVLGT